MPVYEYMFLAVIKLDRKSIIQSAFDLEDKVGMFPPLSSERSIRIDTDPKQLDLF